MEARNCFNRLDLGEESRAVTSYVAEVNEELIVKGAAKVFSLGNIRLYECPLSYISEDTVDILRLVYAIKEWGCLLYGGGLGEQPAWLIEALEICRAEDVAGKATEPRVSG